VCVCVCASPTSAMSNQVHLFVCCLFPNHFQDCCGHHNKTTARSAVFFGTVSRSIQQCTQNLRLAKNSDSMVYCGAFEPGASGLPYYCTPPVCVPAVLGALAVWRHNKQNKKCGWVFFISGLQKDVRKDPQVYPKFGRSLFTTKFFDVAPIDVVINIWNLP